MSNGSWFHCSVKPVSRSAGRSVVAAAAYRLGECLHDEMYDVVHDYTRKRGVEATFTVAPEGAPEWAHRPEELWNAAEKRETRKNSTLAREVELALPSFLPVEDRQAIVERFATELVERYKVAVSVAIHEPGRQGDDRNYHAHILFTTREMTPEGLGEKTRILDAKATGPGEVTKLRELSADIINDALRAANSDIRVDHRSFKERGIEQEPTVHLGPEASEMERRGERSGRGDQNRKAQETNETIAELRAAECELAVEQEKATAPPETSAVSRERMAQEEQAFAQSIMASGAVPNIENDGRTWWQRTGARLASKALEIAQAVWDKARDIFARSPGLERGMEHE